MSRERRIHFAPRSMVYDTLAEEMSDETESEVPPGCRYPEEDLAELYRRRARSDRYISTPIRPEYMYPEAYVKYRRTPLAAAAAPPVTAYYQEPPLYEYVYRNNGPQMRRGAPVRRAPPPVVEPPKSARLVKSVSVRAPRIYRRRTGGGAVSKGPSTLCLPLAAQPEESVGSAPARPRYRLRYRPDKLRKFPLRSGADQPPQSGDDELGGARASTQSDDEGPKERHRYLNSAKVNRNVGSDEDDAHENDVDATLMRYEKLLQRSPPPKINRLRVMKPRPPSNLKNAPRPQTTDQAQQSPSPRSPGTIPDGKVDVEEVTTEMLDGMLKSLQDQGLAGDPPPSPPSKFGRESGDNGRVPGGADQEAPPKSPAEKPDEKKTSQSPPSSPVVKPEMRIFNYRDVTSPARSASPSPPAVRATGGRPHTAPLPVSSSPPPAPLLVPPAYLIPPSDELTQLELHRSKSYIVGLIDRALSRELGTVPSDSHYSRGVALGGTRHSTGAESESSMREEPPRMEGSEAGPIAANADGSSTIYQLKQLRWGHLRHIQREMQRLEELERYLDSCGDAAH